MQIGSADSALCTSLCLRLFILRRAAGGADTTQSLRLQMSEPFDERKSLKALVQSFHAHGSCHPTFHYVLNVEVFPSSTVR